MRLFHAYKKPAKALLIFLLLFTLVGQGALVSGESASELKNKIREKDANIADLEKEIAAYQAELDVLGKEKNTLSNSIKELDLTKKKLNTDISVTQKKIDKTNLEIEDLSSDIGDKEQSITNDINVITLGLRKTNELEQENMLSIILSQNSFTNIWTDIDDLATLQTKIRESVKELKETKGKLEDNRAETIKAKTKLTTLKTELADQQKIVIQNTNQKNALLKQTKNNEANYQTLLKDRIAKRDAFEQELRDYEAQLQFILDPSKLPSRGVLSWPLQDVFVTQLFGKTSASGRLYASGTHNGVDFRASVGTPIMAMADGTVQGTGDTDLTCYGASFGRYVFIKYTNGLSSTFGHLSLIKVHEGQQVGRGEIVGYSGATGHVTGPHLHVSLYASEAVKMQSKPSVACDGRTYRLPVAAINAYLDAMYYLPPYKAP